MVSDAQRFHVLLLQALEINLRRCAARVDTHDQRRWFGLRFEHTTPLARKFLLQSFDPPARRVESYNVVAPRAREHFVCATQERAQRCVDESGGRRGATVTAHRGHGLIDYGVRGVARRFFYQLRQRNRKQRCNRRRRRPGGQLRDQRIQQRQMPRRRVRDVLSGSKSARMPRLAVRRSRKLEGAPERSTSPQLLPRRCRDPQRFSKRRPAVRLAGSMCSHALCSARQNQARADRYPYAGKEIGGIQALAARALQFRGKQFAFATRNAQSMPIRRDDGAGSGPAACAATWICLCAPDPQVELAQLCGGNRKWIEGTYAPREQIGRLAPIEQRFALVELVRVGHAL